MSFSKRFWWVALLVAWSFDFLFYGKPPGISFLLWTIVALSAGLWLAKLEHVRPSRLSWVLVVAIVVTAFISFLRLEEFTRFIGMAATLGLMILLAASFRTGDWLTYRISDYVVSFLRLLGNTFSLPSTLLRSNPSKVNEGEPEQTKNQSLKRAAPVLRGILLALPVVAILAALLASADPIFNDQLTNLLQIFDIQHLPENIFRLIYILIMAYLLTGIYLSAIASKTPEPLADSSQPRVKPFLGMTETGIILASVNLLFGFFVVIQFRYFFGGQANIHAAGYTYSEYARKGFSELVIVSLLSLMLYLVLGAITHRDNRTHQHIFTTLNIFMIGFVLVILVSAFQRLRLYEDAYGFSRLRTYTHVFILFLGALLVTTVLLELFRQRRYFALATLITVFAFTLSLAGLNVDAFVARQNIQRAVSGQELDAYYLGNLSYDALPAVLKIYQNETLPSDIHNLLGAELACREFQMTDEKPLPWQGLNISTIVAKNLLQTQNQSWQEFTTRENPDHGIDVLVKGTYQPCAKSWRENN